MFKSFVNYFGLNRPIVVSASVMFVIMATVLYSFQSTTDRGIAAVLCGIIFAICMIVYVRWNKNKHR